MDDSCAVCAESLEWAAYGPCGHRDVCSNCVVRLRFICNDRHCCICKAESGAVFVTKALGDYTRMINDFSVLPSELKDGRVGSYWYHEDTQTFFDDVDQYKIIKAMCRLSCSVCDKMNDLSNEGPKKQARFRNIEQLKGHLFHQHKLLMCSLCLEGRKVFVSEQNLYTRAQLNQHINTGDSEVDGSESDRGGFMGHPMCEFCRTPFYGDNELYSHMSTEHYTCHICQRHNPGQYEYYKNYDDLEIHFRREHFLCEDENCLAKKFLVFQSESEMKRHNAKEHGGRMSRAQRNAALQIPTSFRFKRSDEQYTRRISRDIFFREPSENQNQLSMAIEASLEMANSASSFHDPSSSSSSSVRVNGVDPITESFGSLGTTDYEPTSRYSQATSNSRNVSLEESSFPPLPVAPKISQQNHSGNLRMNTMTDRLRRQSLIKKKKSLGPLPSSSSSTPSWPKTNNTPISSNGTLQIRQAKPNGTSTKAWSSIESSTSQFPPVSSTQNMPKSSTSSSQLSVKVNDDVHTINRSLVEKIRDALENDEEKYNAFKEISGQYRLGSIHTVEYLASVQEFGLLHLVLDLARLCPDAQKQKELLETYNDNMQNNVSTESKRVQKNNSNSSKKGKGKHLVADAVNSKRSLPDNVINSVREIEGEEMSENGYRASKGKSVVTAEQEQADLSSATHTSTEVEEIGDLPSGAGPEKKIWDDSSGIKQHKKIPKFLRARLGDGSAEAYVNSRKSDPEPEPEPEPKKDSMNGNNVQSVWGAGRSRKLYSTALKY